MEGGFTMVPNNIICFLMPHLKGGETKVLLYLLRKTIGRRDSTDSISYSQMRKGVVTRDGELVDLGTKLAFETIADAIRLFEKLALFFIDRESGKTLRFTFNEDFKAGLHTLSDVRTCRDLIQKDKELKRSKNPEKHKKHLANITKNRKDLSRN